MFPLFDVGGLVGVCLLVWVVCVDLVCVGLLYWFGLSWWFVLGCGLDLVFGFGILLG